MAKVVIASAVALFAFEAFDYGWKHMPEPANPSGQCQKACGLSGRAMSEFDAFSGRCQCDARCTP